MSAANTPVALKMKEILPHLVALPHLRAQIWGNCVHSNIFTNTDYVNYLAFFPFFLNNPQQ